MAVDAPTIARFLWRNQRRHENDRYAVQRPIRFELRRDFDAVLLRHDKIDKHEVRFETAPRFQCAARIARSGQVRFGEAPKPAREARALPRERVCRGKHIGIRIRIDGCCLPSAGAALRIVNVKIRYSERSLRRL